MYETKPHRYHMRKATALPAGENLPGLRSRAGHLRESGEAGDEDRDSGQSPAPEPEQKGTVYGSCEAAAPAEEERVPGSGGEDEDFLRTQCHLPGTGTEMRWCVNENARGMRMNSVMKPTDPFHKAPDPLTLSIAREMQERLRPAEIILLGSRATGEHRHDSDVDLMAVCPDDTALRETDRTLRRLLEGKFEVPVVNVTTITREKFLRTAPLP